MASAKPARGLAFHRPRRCAVSLYEQVRQRQSRRRLDVLCRRQPHGTLCHHPTGRAPPDAGRKSAAGMADRSTALRRRAIPMGAFPLPRLSRAGSRLRRDLPSARPLFHELPRRLGGRRENPQARTVSDGDLRFAGAVVHRPLSGESYRVQRDHRPVVRAVRGTGG